MRRVSIKEVEGGLGGREVMERREMEERVEGDDEVE